MHLHLVGKATPRHHCQGMGRATPPSLPGCGQGLAAVSLPPLAWPVLRRIQVTGPSRSLQHELLLTQRHLTDPEATVTGRGLGRPPSSQGDSRALCW